MKANEIIQKAKDQADNEFRDYPAQIEREFLDYPGTIQEMAKDYITVLQKRRLSWINAREEDRLINRITMIINDEKFPEINKPGMFFAESVPIDERILFVLKNQYILNKKIDYLKSTINKLKKKATEQKHELSMKQIALIYYYNREQVTRENCKDKAEKQGHISGNKLYNFYCYYSSRSNRTNPEETAIKTRNKINLIESIIQHLSTEHKQEAIDELSTLKSKENKYI